MRIRVGNRVRFLLTDLAKYIRVKMAVSVSFTSWFLMFCSAFAVADVEEEEEAREPGAGGRDDEQRRRIRVRVRVVPVLI